jgi:hypothetical protein
MSETSLNQPAYSYSSMLNEYQANLGTAKVNNLIANSATITNLTATNETVTTLAATNETV